MKREQPVFAPIFVAYMATILIVRVAFYFIGKFGLPEPQIQVNNVHIHHYIFGITILFLVAITAINEKFSRKTLSILLGISLAMIIDESQFLITLSEVKYPVLEINTIGIVGFFLLLFAAIEKFSLNKNLSIPKLRLIPKFDLTQKFGFVPKFTIHIALWVIIFAGLFGIKPIKAEMIEHKRAISRYLPRVHMYYNQQASKYSVHE